MKSQIFTYWIILSGIALTLSAVLGGFSQPIIAFILIIIAQQIAISLRNFNWRQLLWSLQIPSFILAIKISSILSESYTDNIYLKLLIAYVLVSLTLQFVICLLIKKFQIIWLFSNLVAVTFTLFLWKIKGGVFLSVPLLDYLIIFLIGSLYGFITFQGFRLSGLMKNQFKP